MGLDPTLSRTVGASRPLRRIHSVQASGRHPRPASTAPGPWPAPGQGSRQQEAGSASIQDLQSRQPAAASSVFGGSLHSRQQVVGALHALAQQRMAIHAWAIPVVLKVPSFSKAALLERHENQKREKKHENQFRKCHFLCFPMSDDRGEGICNEGKSKKDCLRPGSDAWKS